jgi:hypothetical protein
MFTQHFRVLMLAGLMMVIGCGSDTASMEGALSDDELMLTAELGQSVPQVGAPPTERSGFAGSDGIHEMDWNELLPQNFSFEPYMNDLDLTDFNIADLDDNDPEAQRLYQELKAILADVPSVTEIAGMTGRLPGFAVPIEFDGDRVYSFLLVPYFGACIHTPPPPANQMVYVEYEAGFRLPSLYDPVIIEGVFEVEQHVAEGLGTAGYRMQANRVTLY